MSPQTDVRIGEKYVTNEFHRRVALLLTAARGAAGISQLETAKRAGVPRTRISMYERGAVTPRPEAFAKFAGAVGVPPALLAAMLEALLAANLDEQK